MRGLGFWEGFSGWVSNMICMYYDLSSLVIAVYTR
jgi:hypothetical protein